MKILKFNQVFEKFKPVEIPGNPETKNPVGKMEGITNETQLIQHISKNINKSFASFVKRFKLPFKKYNITVYESKHSHHIELKTDNVIDQAGDFMINAYASYFQKGNSWGFAILKMGIAKEQGS